MSCFPTGKYARYKRATAFFLDWLLRAQGRGRSGKNVHLGTLNDVVKEIATDSSKLTPKLLQELPKALTACQYAITLRQHVATFFPDHDKGQVGHQHFMGLLRSWHRILKGVQMDQSDGAVDVEKHKFGNYYQVLQTDEDFFPDEDVYVVEPEASKSVKVDRKCLFEEAFVDEMRLEVTSFFMELDELMQSVYKIYVDVKKEKCTLVEATVVAKLAMDTAGALSAQLQLKYPALRTGQDMYNVVKNIDPEKFRQRMAAIHTKYLTDLQDSLLNGDGVAPYVPGMFLLDFVGVGTTLDSFLTAIPTDPTKSINFPPGCFGEAYGEDRTPQYVLLPDPNKRNVFLLQQLRFLHKTIVEKKIATGSGYDSSAPMESFMVLMEKYFTAREVTVPVVFACICWLKSVAALQGDGGLGRNVSLTFNHSTELLRNIEATVAKGSVRMVHKKTDDFLQLCATEIKRSVQRRYLARANPLLAGLTMLDHHFMFSHLSSEVLLVTSRLRSFGHLYNALVKEGYLESIPFLDDMLEVYSEMIFTPSKTAAIRGAYYHTLLLSVDLRTTSVDAVRRGEDLPAGSGKFKKRKAFHLSDLSKTYRLMINNDKSMLEGTSWADILDNAANICSNELFETRVLSRDLLKLNDELMDMYSELCGELKHGDYGTNINNQRELEDGVIMVLLQLLDALQPDESLNVRAMPEGVIPSTHKIDIEVARNMCKKAANVIRTKFTIPPLVCEQRYFTFPAQPNFVSQEYDFVSFDVDKSNVNREQVFYSLMELLQNSDGPLTGSNVDDLKSWIKKDPLLLSATVCDNEVNTTSNPPGSNNSLPAPRYDDLCTLLHQAAAGPAHDAELVEWMIQMGALAVQPTLHCRKETLQKCKQKCLRNVMAVHSAAIAGYGDIVQIILEADNFVDLNTPTFHTKETVAHLAVKHGHRRIFNNLVWFGADLRIKDGHERRVYDVAANPDWARDIAVFTVHAYRSTSNNAGKHENRLYSVGIKPQRNPAATQLDERSSTARDSTSASPKKGSKKTLRKKSSICCGGGAKRSSVLSTATPAATGAFAILESKPHLLQRLHTSAPPSRRCY